MKLQKFVRNFREMLNRSNSIINSIAKGMIAGNVLISNGGGVRIEKLL